MTTAEPVCPRGRWKLSRPCYDKPHRCPGWAGGGWTYPPTARCVGGYITYGMSREEFAALGELRWRRYPRPFALGQCTQCDVIVLPSWTRKLSLLWWRRVLWCKFTNWLWWRRAAVTDWWRHRSGTPR